LCDSLLYIACYAVYAYTTKRAGSGGAPFMVAAVCCGVGLVGWLAVVLAQVRRGAWAPLRVTRATLAAGLCSVLILISSTASYAIPAVSLVLPLLLNKGGVLAMAPLLDRRRGAVVTPRAWCVLGLAVCGMACGIVPGLLTARAPTLLALALSAAYLLGYVGKLSVIGEQKGNAPFLREEMSVTTVAALPVALLLGVLLSPAPAVALTASLSNGWVYVAGLASQGCGYFGGMLLMRQAPHSLCVPLNRAASVLAGLLASCALGRWPSRWEIFGASVMTIALAVGVWPVRAKRAARLDLRAKVALWRLAHAEPSAA
jgi:drug/metabolite transporter (DMT)-like permease